MNLKRDINNIPLQEMVTFRLSRVNSKLNTQAIRILKKSAGLSLTQWRVMVMIDSLGPLAPSEIARRAAFDKGQLSRCLKGMITSGMLHSESSDSDHRSHVLSLTSAGLELFHRARPHMRKRQLHLVDSLTKAERDMLFHVLDKLELASTNMEETF